jgi:hypothetical protein
VLLLCSCWDCFVLSDIQLLDPLPVPSNTSFAINEHCPMRADLQVDPLVPAPTPTQLLEQWHALQVAERTSLQVLLQQGQGCFDCCARASSCDVVAMLRCGQADALVCAHSSSALCCRLCGTARPRLQRCSELGRAPTKASPLAAWRCLTPMSFG